MFLSQNSRAIVLIQRALIHPISIVSLMETFNKYCKNIKELLAMHCNFNCGTLSLFSKIINEQIINKAHIITAMRIITVVIEIYSPLNI